MRPGALSVVAGMAMLMGVAGCGDGAAEVSEENAAFQASITGTSSALVIAYSLENTSDQTLVAYNRLEDSPAGKEFHSDVARVYVSPGDGMVEIAKKIDHPCHDHPDWDDCAAEEPVTWRIGGTLLEPGEELGERIELPARGEGGFIETRGQSVTFCLGVAAIDDDHPASPDGLYPPTSPQTVLCSEPVTVDS